MVKNSSSFPIFLKKKSSYFQSLILQELNNFWKASVIQKQSGLSAVKHINSFIAPAFNQPCHTHFKNPTKKLRPILGYLMFHALGGKNFSSYKKLFILPEILHNSSLIIDDIEDDAKIRRNKPCLHKTHGIDTAVNLANGLYFLPFYILNNAKLKESLKLHLITILTESMNRIHLGQGLDILWHKSSVSISPKQYEIMARLKTSSFFRAEVQIAALLSSSNQTITKNAVLFAENIGMAFQIIDDVLDLTEDAAATKRFGKCFAQDIAEGKKTLIVSYTLQRASKNEKKELLFILNQKSRDIALARKAIALFNKYNAINDARKYAEKTTENSWNNLSRLLPASSSMDLLCSYKNFLFERTF